MWRFIIMNCQKSKFYSQLIIIFKKKKKIHNYQSDFYFLDYGDIKYLDMIRLNKNNLVIKQQNLEVSKQQNNLLSSPTQAKFQRISRKGPNTPQSNPITEKNTPSNSTSNSEMNEEKPKIPTRFARQLEKKEQTKSVEDIMVFKKISTKNIEELKIQNSQTLAFLPSRSPREAQSKNTQQKLISNNKADNIFTPKYKQQISESSINAITIPKIINTSMIGRSSDKNLKPISILVVLISKTLKKKKQNHFKTIKSYAKALKTKIDLQSRILLRSLSNFSRIYQLICFKQAFKRFKIISGKRQKEIFINQQEIIKINQKKQNEHLWKSIDSKFYNRLRVAFQKLKTHLSYKINQCQALNSINKFQKRKFRYLFQTFLTNFYQNYHQKKYLFQFLVRFIKKYGILKFSFEKIKKESLAFQKLKSLSAPNKIQQKKISPKKLLSDQIEDSDISKSHIKIIQIKKYIEEVQQNIAGLQETIKQKQTAQTRQIKSLKNQIQNLRESNKKLLSEVETKKQLNHCLKQKNDCIIAQNSFNEIEEAQISKQNYSTILQQLFSKIRKMSEAQFERYIKTDFEKQRLRDNTVSSIVSQWIAIKQKVKIQSSISEYEKPLIQIASADEDQRIENILAQQNKMIETMIRSYIKERYLWAQVEKFVANF